MGEGVKSQMFTGERYSEKLRVVVEENGHLELNVSDDDDLYASMRLEKLQAYELAMFILKSL